VIADHSSRTVGILAAALTAAIIIPLVLALRPALENDRSASAEEDQSTLDIEEGRNSPRPRSYQGQKMPTIQTNLLEIAYRDDGPETGMG
jgi:hypothetical protein